MTYKDVKKSIEESMAEYVRNTDKLTDNPIKLAQDAYFEGFIAGMKLLAPYCKTIQIKDV